MVFIGNELIAQTANTLPLQPKKLQYAQEVEKEALAKKDTLMLAEAYYLYAKIYVTAHDYLKGKNYFIQSLRIIEKKGDSYHLGRLYCRLADLEIKQTNMTEALKYGRLALAIFQRADSKKGIMEANQLMGSIYIALALQNPSLRDSVLYYCKIGEKMAYQLRDTISIANIDNVLGDFYKRQGDYAKGLVYFQASLKHYQALGHKHQQAAMKQQIALTYLSLGQIDKAYTVVNEAASIYQQLKISDSFTDKAFATIYAEYYRQKEDWKNAYEQVKIMHALDHDQLVSDRNGAVSRLGVEYETEKKEVQLKSQQKELTLGRQVQQNQRRFLAALSVLFLGAIAASAVFYQLFRKNQRLSHQNATLVREQNHRVKNNLQLVSSLLSLQANRLTDEAAKTAVEDSQLRIEVMAVLQRKLYDGDRLSAVNIAEFTKELTEMALQTFGCEHVQVSYHIAPTLEIAADPALRIGLILNELVSNACKYAFSQNADPMLSIACSIKDKQLMLKVADNGTGFQIPDQSSDKTFGMRLIQIQVRQLHGSYHFENKKGCVFEMTCKV